MMGRVFNFGVTEDVKRENVKREEAGVGSSHVFTSSRFSPTSSRFSRGFTFLEVLFAVIILGVGFILLAGLFPAAISQTQANVAETAASSVGRDALRDIQSAVNSYLAPQAAGATPILPMLLPPTNNTSPVTYPNLPVTGLQIMPIPNEIVQVPPSTGAYYGYSTALGTTPLILPTVSPFNLTNPALVALTHVSTTDPRFGWVGFYRRDWITVNGAAVPSPYAQVWIITAQCTLEGQTTFSTQQSVVLTPPSGVGSSPSPGVGNINFIAGIAAIVPVGTTGIYNSYLALPTTGNAFGSPSVYGTPAAPNAFALIVSALGDSNLLGQVVRLGSIYGTDSTGKTTIWSLLPGADLNASDPVLNPSSNPTTLTGGSTALTLGGGGGQAVTVFILGAPLRGGQYEPPAQDITCTSGFIRVSN
jgi:type II secretory pathway pseudopilin PulG